MKRVQLFGAFFASALFLSSTLCAQDSLAELTQALELFKNRDYANAYPLLEKLSEAHPENLDLNLMLGASALELKRYHEAIAAFDRALILDPRNLTARIQIAKINYLLGNTTLASQELDALLKESLPLSVREGVQGLKTQVDQSQSKHSFGGAFILGGEYDSNVNNDIGGRNFTLPSLNLQLFGTNTKSDYAHFQTLVLNHSYDMGEKEGWKWDSSLVAYNKTYFDTSTRNLVLFSLSTGPSYTQDGYQLSLPVTLDKVYLASDSYLDIAGAGIRLKKLLSPRLMLDGGYSRKYNSYAQEFKARNSDTNLFYLGARQAIGEESPYLLSLYFAYRTDKERNDLRSDVSYDEWGGRIELSKEIFDKFSLTGGYSYKKTSYSDTDALYLNHREDKERRYELGVTHELSRRSTVGLNVAYVDHPSNHDPFDYDKRVVTLRYMVGF
ncbi:tetratricopeptide repeat protein [Wolinella succinogenes]|uniref:Surface lipoprotein assembly modifier C-terminal domain-containing protein n=1 Tax=Wolinella succinogenes (strain ATCC 29543 / DSM 1740 / CCUG 13145 / JCM 31913 / LMG 7466 / NCTC 11488 / FDC 602W) TaxID=273121 RepID=Q7MR63_WOLSU|nr:tetratricopeptide repeat protein [Wolinella succinogenes]CAE10663.1 hypothetical protein WS1632 [Wolinella succinogenes]VEG80810.1 Cytochrome c biogenesis factor [Wolinella succinogenes]HCZ18662.1 DUF560 domain-containing protein [Helicobacter sp.]